MEDAHGNETPETTTRVHTAATHPLQVHSVAFSQQGTSQHALALRCLAVDAMQVLCLHRRHAIGQRVITSMKRAQRSSCVRILLELLRRSGPHVAVL